MSHFQSLIARLERFGRGRESYLFLPLVAALLLGVIWWTINSLISLEHASAERAAAALSLELVETYEAQMLRNLGVIDQTLKVIKYSYEDGAKSPSLADLKAKGLLPTSLVFSISVANKSGVITSSNHAHQSDNIANQSYFLAHMDSDSAKPYVGVALRQSVSGEWVLPFSLRLNAADGSFDGVAILAVAPEYFTSGYEPSKMGLHGLLALLGSDGKFRVRRTGEKIALGEEVDYVPLIRSLEHHTTHAEVYATPWDGTRRFAQARKLYGFPLAVIVGLSEEEQFAEYRGRKQTYLWRGIFASIFLAMVFAALTYLARQLAASRSQTREVHEAYNARIRAQVEERERFLAAASHDLRTPLTRMKLRLEELSSKSEKGKLQQDVCEMAEVLDATLSYFRDDVQSEARQLLDIDALVHSMADDARESGRDLLVVGSALPILVQPISARSCISNLVQNALRYGEAARIYLNDSAEFLTIEVHDRGPGIPEDKLATVFEPFVRLEPSRNKNTGGFGLGLSIAQAAAKKNDAELTLRNAPEGGLIARIVFLRVSP